MVAFGFRGQTPNTNSKHIFNNSIYPIILSALPSVFPPDLNHKRVSEPHPFVWGVTFANKEQNKVIWRFLKKMFVWVQLHILQSWNRAESVNPATICDGGEPHAQHSPLWGWTVVYPSNVHFIGNLTEPSHCLLCSAVWRSRGQQRDGQCPSITITRIS